MMRFQRLSHGGSHWGFRKLILKRCQPDTASTIESNPRKCMSTSGQAEKKTFYWWQIGIRFSHFEIVGAATDTTLPHHALCPACCLSPLFWRLSCLKRLLSCPMWRLSCHTWLVFGQLWHFSFQHTGCHVLSGEGCSRYLSGDFDDGWQSGRGLAKSFKGHETSAPPLLMVMNGALALTLPPPYFMLFSLYTLTTQLTCLLNTKITCTNND